MNRNLSVRPAAGDRAARRRLVWLLLRNGDLTAEPLWSERGTRDTGHRAPSGGAADGRDERGAHR